MGELSVTLHLQVEPPLVVGEFYCLRVVYNLVVPCLMLTDRKEADVSSMSLSVCQSCEQSGDFKHFKTTFVCSVLLSDNILNQNNSTFSTNFTSFQHNCNVKGAPSSFSRPAQTPCLLLVPAAAKFCEHRLMC